MRYQFDLDLGDGYFPIPLPENYEQIKLNLVFFGQIPSITVSGTDFIFRGETAKKLKEYRDKGLSGGYGIYYAPVLKITACDNSGVFYLDLDITAEQARWECDRVSVPVRQHEQVDWLNEIAGGISFAYLASGIRQDIAGFYPPTSPGAIRFNDFKKTPYAISEIPDATTVMSGLMDLTLLALQIKQAVEDLILSVRNLIGLFGRYQSQLVGDAAVIGTIVGAAIYIGKATLNVFRIFANIIVIYFLLKLFSDTLNNMLKAIVQRKKYKLCMREADLFQKICDYAGLKFSSSIYAVNSKFYNATWMPRKTVYEHLTYNEINSTDVASELYNTLNISFEKIGSEENNFKAFGYFEGTAKEFIEEMMLKYDAAYSVYDGTLFFEQRQNLNRQTNFLPKNSGDIGNTYNLPEPSGTNAAALSWQYSLQFQVDESELNTLNRYKGTTAQVSVTPNIEGDKRRWLNPKGKVIQLNHATAKRKDYLTNPEKLIKTFQDFYRDNLPIILVGAYATKQIAITALGGALGGIIYSAATGLKTKQPSDFPLDKFDGDRIGWMLLSNDSFSIPKSFIGMNVGNDWLISPESEDIMNARYLLTQLHAGELAVTSPVTGKHNQHKIYRENKFSFCCADFNQLQAGNAFTLPDGRKGYWQQLSWNLESEEVDESEYWINDKFTENLKAKYFADGEPI